MNSLPSDFLLATTLRAIGDGVISCDADGQIVLMNLIAQQLTGWTEAEAVGRLLKDVFVIVDEATRQILDDPFAKVVRTGRIVDLASRVLLVRRDGSEVAVDDSAAPIRDADGRLRGVVLVFREVSARRSAERNLEMLSESGRVLGEARETQEILRRVSEVSAKHFADFCVFDVLGEGGTGAWQRITGRHHNPALQALADEFGQIQPDSTTENTQVLPAAIRRVLETGEPCLLAEVGDAQVEMMASGHEQLGFLRQRLKPRSILCVPLVAVEQEMGALTFFRHALPGAFTELDVSAAAELGRRIAMALQHAAVLAELRQQRARLDAVVKAVPVGLVIADASGRILSANTEMERIFRHPIRFSSSVEAYAEYVAFHPEGPQVRGEEYPLGRAMRENRAIRDERYIYQRGDGTRAWVSLSAAPVRLEDGTVLGGVVAISDIDELVRAQKQASAEKQRAETSDQRMRLLLERASVGVAIGDMHGRLFYANDVLLRWLGYSREEMRRGAVHWDALTPPEFAAQDRRAREELTTNGRAEPYERVYVAKDGTHVPMLVGTVALPAEGDRDHEGQIAAFYTDLTLQKRAETALLQTEKLTAVGRLASSISHEINNPLESVTNLLYLIGTDAELSGESREYLETADRELARVTQIVSQTLRFHRQSTTAVTMAPEHLLEEVLSIYRTRLANSAISVERRYGQGVAVTSFEGDIRQVLSNLIGNAFDAMRQGGTLRLRTHQATLWSTGEAGVAILIADTGTGMPEAVRARIFEAFYSTKGIQGTGLGLWISQRIMHKHGGRLDVRSAEGERHGTVFRLWLPQQLAASANGAWHEA